MRQPSTSLTATTRRISYFFGWLLFFLAEVAYANEAYLAMGVTPPKQRIAAPDFRLPTLQGKTVHLSDYNGRPILLTFWATWCVPCRQEMSAMQNLWEKFRHKGFVVLAVNIEKNNRNQVEKFTKKLGLTFPILIDTTDINSLYEVDGLPTSYLVARDGKFDGRIVGDRPWDGAQAHAMIETFVQTD